jgi:hypothetical protein
MSNTRVEVWRRRLGLVSTVLGLLLFATSYFIYLRYASDSTNLHMQERLHHARALGILWEASFFGSMLLLVLSLFGLGWGRLAGLVVNTGAFLGALMTLGAMCGPFGC